MGHCLTVARTKDHPFFELLEDALIYECGNISLLGKWEKVYANKEELISQNKDEINSEAKDCDGNLDEAVKSFMESNFMEYGDDNAIYQKVSAQFDYMGRGWQWSDIKLDEIMKYKDVVEKSNNGISAFITPDYDFICTDYVKCPFAEDDLVHVIDGHM